MQKPVSKFPPEWSPVFAQTDLKREHLEMSFKAEILIVFVKRRERD